MYVKQMEIMMPYYTLNLCRMYSLYYASVCFLHPKTLFNFIEGLASFNKIRQMGLDL